MKDNQQEREKELRGFLIPAELVPDLEAQIVNQILDLFTKERQALRKKIEGMEKINADYPFGCGREKENYNQALSDILALLTDEV